MKQIQQILSISFIVMFLNISFCLATPAYIAHKTHDSIKLDGILDESSWQSAEPLHFVIPVSLDTPQNPTSAKILWDNNYLYIGIVATDRDIKAVLTRRDSSTYLDDALEIFLKPDSESNSYVNFEINALGTVYDALNNHSPDTRPAKFSYDWNCDDLKLGIQTKGTLNYSQDTDESWTLELRIPFSCLTSVSNHFPKTGDQWTFHVARYDYSVYLPKGKELSSSAPLTRVNFHNYKDWMILEFGK